MQQAPDLSDRTKFAIQDYTALNTIISSIEALQAANAAKERPDDMALQIVATFLQLDHGEHGMVTLRMNCPLGRRAAALGMLARTAKGAVIRRPHAR